MNIDSLNQTDSKKMFQIYDKWPEIARDTYGSSLETVEFKDINHIVFSGMGGSGAIADIFYSILLSMQNFSNFPPFEKPISCAEVSFAFFKM